MALINCYECKSSVSTEASTCPRCGAPVKPRPSSSHRTEQTFPKGVKGVKDVDKTVTTQLTSKMLKLQLILSKALLVLGVTILWVGVHQQSSLIQYLGGVLGVIALLWIGATNLRIFWDHK
jgi:hypothetical protein